MVFVFFLVSASFAQGSESYYYENEFNFEVPLFDNTLLQFGIGNRGRLYERLKMGDVSGYRHQYFELSQIINYQADNNLEWGMGTTYQFRNLFDGSKKDEIRITEQLIINSIVFPFHQRLRAEQRFKKNTIHRFRYKLSFVIPVNKHFKSKVGTESLYSISQITIPQADQRIFITFHTNYFENITLQLGLQYRIENYFHEISKELFLSSDLSISLGNLEE